ncbi:hypothetical protein EB796_006184 [Bugula neritina]|uniref:Uncharacterized protein n=1 Tax=Bugula neritina TaxID=10212 RepID=A0A7J7KD16_BUGNE|nr:hypothetical protein EB796_006184 [Bugula neritina]
MQGICGCVVLSNVNTLYRTKDIRPEVLKPHLFYQPYFRHYSNVLLFGRWPVSWKPLFFGDLFVSVHYQLFSNRYS